MWHNLLKLCVTYWSVTWLTEMWHNPEQCDAVYWGVTWLTEMWQNPVQCDATYWSVAWPTEVWHSLLKCDITLSSVTQLTEVGHDLLKCDTTYWSESERMPLQSGNTGAVQEDVLPWVGPEAFPLHLQLKDMGWMAHNLSNTKCMQVTFLWHVVLHQLFFRCSCGVGGGVERGGGEKCEEEKKDKNKNHFYIVSPLLCIWPRHLPYVHFLHP